MKTHWKRFRFKTKAVDDCRPLISNINFPWWISGEAADGSYATIVAWLPDVESLADYWDDAYNVEIDAPFDNIEFTKRFPKPDWWKPLKIELSEQDIIEIYNNIHFPVKRRVSEANQITHYETLKRFAEEALNYHQLKS